MDKDTKEFVELVNEFQCCIVNFAMSAEAWKGSVLDNGRVKKSVELSRRVDAIGEAVKSVTDAALLSVTTLCTNKLKQEYFEELEAAKQAKKEKKKAKKKHKQKGAKSA